MAGGRKKTINLLPSELAVGSDVVGKVKTLTTLATAYAAVLFVLFALGVGTLFFLSQRRSSLQAEGVDLRDSVKSLESAEQGLVVTRDRVGKIKGIIAERQVENRISSQARIVETLPENLVFKKSEVQKSESKLTLEGSSSVAISDLFDSFFAVEGFTRIALESLDFNLFSGFKVVLDVL